MAKAVIGIVSKHFLRDYKRPDVYVKEELKQAIFDVGAIAIGILSPNTSKDKATETWEDRMTTEEKENLYAQIDLCDGIILQGGGFSDEYECLIAKYCYDFDIPILGICAGMNNMIRAVRGEILKPKSLESHRSEEDYVHEIIIDKESKFYEIVTAERLNVNSRHKCRVLDCGPLTPVAYAPDGVIEVVEDKTKRFYIATQFHPESLYKFDKNMFKIFKYFVEVSYEKKNS